MAKRRPSGGSLVEDVYHSLRHDIVYGDVPPGQRLPANELAKARGVSLGVVREALTRLVSERLLEASPQYGFWVPKLSIADLDDLTWTRVRIETLCVTEAITHGDLAWEAALVAAHHALANTEVFESDGSYSRDWMVIHNAFHAALAAGCPHPRMLHIRQQLYDASERFYRYWSAGSDYGAKRIQKEHKTIVDAALSRDVTGTTEVLERHLTKSAERLRERATAHFASEASEPAK